MVVDGAHEGLANGTHGVVLVDTTELSSLVEHLVGLGEVFVIQGGQGFSHLFHAAKGTSILVGCWLTVSFKNGVEHLPDWSSEVAVSLL